MTHPGRLIACTLLLLPGARGLAEGWGVELLRDDFDGPALSSTVWTINHPGHTWWVQGRTHFPDPLTTSGPFPHIAGGACVIEHHLYNPYHLGTPKTTFLGGEVRTTATYGPESRYRFEARVRCGAQPDGLVTSQFTYGYDGSHSDEIDFEFLSKQTNDDVAWPDGDPVLTNPWNESAEKPAYVAPTGLDLTEWNTFRIYWSPDRGRVEWTWVTAGGEVVLRTETDPAAVPDEPMALYFNFWAPAATWTDAHDAGLQPAQDPADDEAHLYEIDHAEVLMRHPGDATLDAVVDVLDLARLANHFGETDAGWTDADFNGDGAVDVLDLATIANHFGWTGGSTGPAAGGAGRGEAIPEPATPVLLAAVLPWALKRRLRCAR